MKKLLITTALALMSFPVIAGDLDSKLMSYVEFIESESTMKYNGEPLPEVVSEVQDMIQIRAYGDLAVAQSEYNKKPLGVVNALYDHKTNVIYVSDRIDLDSQAAEPTLVHEMVHFMQKINGETDSLDEKWHICLEGPAYDLQAEWQRLNGVTEGMPTREQVLMVFMRCSAQQTFPSSFTK